MFDPLLSHLAAQLASLPTGQRRFCVAYSGGLDSSVLLHALARLLATPVGAGAQLCAVHVHHGLSAYADAWAAHCLEQAYALGVPLQVVRVHVAAQGQGIEAAARSARHAAFAEQACDWRVLAHHQDDQAETLLHRLMRGTGVQGAAAMQVQDSERGLWRPLLACSRQQLQAWASAQSLRWIEDDSNTNTHYTRNFLRQTILPQLAQRQTGVAENFARAAMLFGEGAALLNVLAEQDACLVGQHLAALLALGEVRGRNLLRYLLAQQRLAAPSFERLQEAWRQLSSAQAGFRLDLGEAALCVWQTRFWVEPAALPALPVPHCWQGESELVWAAGRVRFKPAQGPNALKLKPGKTRLQTRQSGASLRLHHNGPRQDFKKLAQQQGVPTWRRPFLPCLYVGEQCVWIAQLGTAADWRCAAGEAGWLVVWET